MIKQIFKLVKINTLNLFSFKSKKISKVKILLYSLFFIYVFGCLFFALGFTYNTMLDSLQLNNVFIPIIFAGASIMIFFLTMYTAKSILFESKDNDFLLALPIKSISILTSRLLSLLMIGFVIGVFITAPGLIVYAIKCQPSISFYVMYLVAMLFIPTASIILSSLVGYLLAFINSRLKLNNVFEMIYYLLFTGAALYLYSNFNQVLSLITNNPDVMLKIIKYAFFPIYLLFKAFSLNSFIYLLYYVLVNLGLIFVFVVIFQKSYLKILFRLNYTSNHANYVVKDLKSNNLKKALLKKEFSRVFKSPVCLFNMGFSLLLLLILAIASLFGGFNSVLEYFSYSGESYYSFILLIVSLMIVLSNFTCVSISLEGNNLWILKSLPIDVKDIFNAKILFNLIAVILVVTVSLILFLIGGFLTGFEFICLLIYCVSLSLVVSIYGLIINLCFPNLNAVSDAHVVKRSMSAVVAPISLMIIIMILLIFISNLKVHTLLIISVCLLFIALLLKTILNKYGVKKFSNL